MDQVRTLTTLFGGDVAATECVRWGYLVSVVDRINTSSSSDALDVIINSKLYPPNKRARGGGNHKVPGQVIYRLIFLGYITCLPRHFLSLFVFWSPQCEDYWTTPTYQQRPR